MIIGPPQQAGDATIIPVHRLKIAFGAPAPRRVRAPASSVVIRVAMAPAAPWSSSRWRRSRLARRHGAPAHRRRRRESGLVGAAPEMPDIVSRLANAVGDRVRLELASRSAPTAQISEQVGEQTSELPAEVLARRRTRCLFEPGFLAASRAGSLHLLKDSRGRASISCRCSLCTLRNGRKRTLRVPWQQQQPFVERFLDHCCALLGCRQVQSAHQASTRTLRRTRGSERWRCQTCLQLQAPLVASKAARLLRWSRECGRPHHVDE